MSEAKPQAYATGKPRQPLFVPVLEKLEDAKPPLSVFITERSWLIFQVAEGYLRLTQPGPDHPEDAKAPILTNGYRIIPSFGPIMTNI